jgi:hypothetical protein
MGKLDEAGLDAIIAGGCPACRSGRLQFRAYLDGRLPLLGGEPVGPITWVYDGERFVDGTFEILCADCKHEVWRADVCPRCDAPGALASVLATNNRWPVPKTCSSCDDDEVRYLAMIPARVVYEGKRAEKPRTTVELYDPGFHGYAVDCADCGPIAQLVDRCPLCVSPAPLRPRPGG